MLTVSAVAKRYGVSVATVRAWLRSGELKGVNVARAAGARRASWRISEGALAAFTAARAATPPAARPARRRRKPEPAGPKWY